jgi:hypothetical protein
MRVAAASIDPETTLEGDTVYDVVERCEACGHEWDHLVCFEPKGH